MTLNILHCIDRIYVGNLTWDVKWQELKDFFRPCGNVVRADVMEDAGGRSKGCGKNGCELIICCVL